MCVCVCVCAWYFEARIIVKNIPYRVPDFHMVMLEYTPKPCLNFEDKHIILYVFIQGATPHAQSRGTFLSASPQAKNTCVHPECCAQAPMGYCYRFIA